MQKTVIIVGASSGIGRSLTNLFLKRGYRVGILARRKELLEKIQGNTPGSIEIQAIDIGDIEKATIVYKAFLSQFESIDLIINCAGTGHLNSDLDLEKELATNKVNIDGFVTITNLSMKYLITQGNGHYAAITSIAAIRGNGEAPAYNASKAYQANYLEGLRALVYHKKLSILITDIKPGFVDTRMAQGAGLFWVASTKKAARQIACALDKKREHVYVTRRWRLVAWVMKILPFCIYKRI